MQKLSLGCIPEEPTSTSYMYEVIAGGVEENRPDTFVIENVPKHYQNGQPCCTCSATSSAKGSQEKKQLSPRVLWAKVKEIDDFPGGAYISTNLKVLLKFGIPEYGIVNEDVHLSEEEYKNVETTEHIKELSQKHKIKSFWWIYSNDLELQYTALTKEKVPLIVVMPWYKEFNYNKGFLPEPKTFSDYHAVILKGRKKDSNGYYRIYQNSHGESWGDKGDFYIYEKDLEKYKLGTHFVIVDIPQEDAKEIKKNTWDPKAPKIKIIRGDEIRYMNEVFIPYLTGKSPNSKGNYIDKPYKLYE